ncbi:MAG TPA: bifunctional [glutamine synthetase] adenylyltransferase/[glutamine synthetase]-adenylyl-L-tyrosine phosphorylase [Rhizomicrobium sp.]|nr:bifunctional [glutamine synthetase] adenylyltransferase/[glutamine synthetase]-adenylyl-L-tyrosine phosphorylase [Rhizomicrobium sp.]
MHCTPAFIVPPRPFDPDRAARVKEALAGHGFESSAPLLDSVFGNSPFLGRLALRETGALAEYFAAGPQVVLNAAILRAHAAAHAASEAQAMTDLRAAKRRAALAIAMADIAGLWDVDQVTAELTRFADACVGAALRFLLSAQARQAGMAETDGEVLEKNAGLTVLAMGKYGAFELNYSSDIDLVVFYDAAKFPFSKRGDMRGAAVDIVRGLVKLLAETTTEGYVFRVDLRLRPDAAATQIAISTDAALDYYEAMGQNWERAAMIKARACAGDAQTSARFLNDLTPFIWRRYLDFAAIEDIHSIKRQIHAHAGHGEIRVAGHNIKLGRGGIREIEFFAQTQQLILGGRHPSLRVPSTLGALDALAAEGRVDPRAAAELKADYRYLRRLEHRLQMIEDQQTHSLPASAAGISHVSCFMGYAGDEEFSAGLTAVLSNVQGHYARLFESEPDLAASEGNLVFTGVEDDPETLKTLKAMGFGEPAHVSGAIRGWHHGRIRAMRSQRARELLTRLVPSILKALAGAPDPDVAFVQFDRFLSNLPSGVQLFSLFLARPQLLGLLARIVGATPRLATYLARNPATLDALLDADFLNRLPARAELDGGFARAMTGSYEEMLDAARRFTREAIFRVGVQIVDGAASADDAGPALADIAESVIAGLLPRVEAELAAAHGRVKGAGFAVVAMGKLGGREMTASSDLDLVFVYDVPPDVEASDGPKPLPPTLYFARLAQRLIAALTTPTAAGTLYEVDMRLRPTGNKGPVAVSLQSFIDYHARESWTWEHMALTRARLVAGPDALRAQVAAEIRRRLTEPRSAAEIVADARDMRDKVAAVFPGGNPWDLKHAPGGLMDIEFVAQAMQLVHAPRRPDVLDPNTVAALEKLKAAALLSAGDADMLIVSARLQHALTQVLRIALDEPPRIEDAARGLKALLTRAAGAGSFAETQARLAELQATTRKVFLTLLPEGKRGPGRAG